MSINKVILLLGTNIKDKKKNLENAKNSITNNGLIITNQTIIIETEAIDFTSENLFLNQIIEVNTDLSPINLLLLIKKIESELGREYTKPKDGEKYTDRLIDIDILIFNQLKYTSEILEIPHPRNFERKFVVDLLAML